MPPHFKDDLHAITTGYLIGALMRSGFSVSMQTDDEGNYLDTFIVTFKGPDDVLLRVPVKVMEGPYT